MLLLLIIKLFFSCDLKKIYNVKKGKTAIYDYQSHGPTFGASTTIINVYGKMFDCNCSTCPIRSSCFDGINSDYEINNGEEYFKLLEIEVFQILYKWIIKYCILILINLINKLFLI